MPTPKRASRGQIIVIFGVACVALFAILSLAIDGGRIPPEPRRRRGADGGSRYRAGGRCHHLGNG
ncbi:MAG: hypothetical protein E6J25_06095 [Chloroflexi bacterium]|nr:MAG: hypothetical protein E6J25_06095 [Chloroflexota bacterium]